MLVEDKCINDCSKKVCWNTVAIFLFIHNFWAQALWYIRKAVIIQNNPLQPSKIKVWLPISEPAHHTASATKCVCSLAKAERFIRGVANIWQARSPESLPPIKKQLIMGIKGREWPACPWATFFWMTRMAQGKSRHKSKNKPCDLKPHCCVDNKTDEMVGHR